MNEGAKFGAPPDKTVSIGTGVLANGSSKSHFARLFGLFRRKRPNRNNEKIEKLPTPEGINFADGTGRNLNHRPRTSHFYKDPGSFLHEIIDHPATELPEVMGDMIRQGRTDVTFCFLNEGALRKRVALFQENFMPNDSDNRRIIYALKANYHQRVIQLMMEAGIDGFDCASQGEMQYVLNNGATPEHIYYHNTNKPRGHMHWAYEAGVPHYSVEDADGLETILEPYIKDNRRRRMQIAVRLATPNPEAKIDLSEEFGCDPEVALALLQRIEQEKCKTGLAVHTGSQNTSIPSYIRAIELMANVAEAHGGVDSVNGGGGFPINYFEGDSFNLVEFLQAITAKIQECRSRIFKKNSHQKIIIEPGRAFVADVIQTGIPVVGVRENRYGKRQCVIGEGIYTMFPDAPHGWQYPLQVYTGDGRPVRNLVETRVKGFSCDSADRLGVHLLPEDLKVGDYVIMSGGAYTDSLYSLFHLGDGPTYVSYNR